MEDLQEEAEKYVDFSFGTMEEQTNIFTAAIVEGDVTAVDSLLDCIVNHGALQGLVDLKWLTLAAKEDRFELFVKLHDAYAKTPKMKWPRPPYEKILTACVEDKNQNILQFILKNRFLQDKQIIDLVDRLIKKGDLPMKLQSDLKMDAQTKKRKLHFCDQCEYSSTKTDHLKIHKRTHTGEKPYKCDECDKAFANSGDLQVHKRIHTGEKPYKCDQCNKAFSKNGNLQTHRRTHTGEKPHKCDQCDKAFVANGYLKKHKRTHTGEKPDKCDQCDKAFVANGYLKKHKRTHTGEKPYKCDQCDKAFSESSSLQKHKRTHTGEKPYKCEHCSKTFSQSNNRSTHVKMHEEQKNYKFVCLMQDCGTQVAVDGDLKCTIRCKTKLDLDYHIQRNHTEDGIAAKFKSEQQLANFFDKQKISYDRDWVNRISFLTCKNIEGSKQSARPDFFLTEKSAQLGCVFLVGNDEFAHRQTKCEFQRIFNIANALDQTPDFKSVPIVYVRFNPHFFRRDGKFFDMPIEKGHELLLEIINQITNIPHKGVNLVYVNYDTENGKLCIFDEDEEEESYSKIFQNQVIQIV